MLIQPTLNNQEGQTPIISYQHTHEPNPNSANDTSSNELTYTFEDIQATQDLKVIIKAIDANLGPESVM